MQTASFCHINNDMDEFRYKLPSASALYAFEAVGRHQSFSRAAMALRTSQPAVSRHIASLEARLGVRLIQRGHGQASLTPHGQALYRAVKRGFGEIVDAIEGITGAHPTISIACTYSITHLWLMPRLEALQSAVGEETEIVARSSDYEYHDKLREEGVDLCLTYAVDDIPGMERFKIMSEAVVPVCSPSFRAANEEALGAGIEGALGHLPILTLSQPNHGWTTWQDWAAAHHAAFPAKPAGRSFTNFVFLIEAAASGAGIALGWRGLIDDEIAAQRLVPAFPEVDWLAGDGGLYLLVNSYAEQRPCLDDAVTFLRQGDGLAAGRS